MSRITIDHHPSEQILDELGVRSWPIWTKEPSEFPWHYAEQERCLILEGDIVVTPDGGEPVEIRAGDLVTFPQGMSCTWQVRQAVRKLYQFG